MDDIQKGRFTASFTVGKDKVLYRVWDPKKGFVAAGQRKNEAEALVAVNAILSKLKG